MDEYSIITVRGDGHCLIHACYESYRLQHPSKAAHAEFTEELVIDKIKQHAIQFGEFYSLRNGQSCNEYRKEVDLYLGPQKIYNLEEIGG